MDEREAEILEHLRTEGYPLAVREVIERAFRERANAGAKLEQVAANCTSLARNASRTFADVVNRAEKAEKELHRVRELHRECVAARMIAKGERDAAVARSNSLTYAHANAAALTEAAKRLRWAKLECDSARGGVEAVDASRAMARAVDEVCDLVDPKRGGGG